jgi:hypothetical protein
LATDGETACCRRRMPLTSNEGRNQMKESEIALFFLMMVMQGSIALAGILYGIVLLIRKDRSYYILFFTITMWGLGVMRVWPSQKLSPWINQIMILLSQICIMMMFILWRKKSARAINYDTSTNPHS